MYEDIIRRLNNEAAACDYRVKMTIQNTAKLKKINDRLDSLSINIHRCKSVMEALDPMIADISEYANNKAKDGQLAINRALEIAGDVIPDSMKGVSFQMEGDKAWLEVNDMVADGVEGSGYKGATSMFVQASVLRQNPSILQTLILDEPLAKVSTENSAVISAVLPYICKDLQVILIEQKKEVFSNSEHVTYLFFKDENGTRVEKELPAGGD